MASFCPDFLRALGFSAAAVPEQNPSQWAEWMSNQKPWGNFDIHLNYFLFVLMLVKRKEKLICNVMWSESIQSNSTALLALFSAAAHMMDSDFIMFTCSCIFISFLYFFFFNKWILAQELSHKNQQIEPVSGWICAQHTGQFLCFLERSSLAESTQRLNEPPDVMLVSLHVPASFNNTY